MPRVDSQNTHTNHQISELDADYVNEAHIEAFANALQAEDLNGQDQFYGASPSTNLSSSVPQSPRVRKVSALSDFAPVNLKLKKRRRRDRAHGKRRDWMFTLLRWPLLLCIFIFIAAEFGLYILIRQLVNTKEWLLAWRGRKGVLRKRLRAATSYEEWKEAALTLDEFMHFNEWKKVDEDPYYDWKLVKKVNRSLRGLREKNDVRGVLGVLEICIRTNFAAVESPRLYSETYLGTKDLIESYYDEQERALQYIRESTDLSNDEKKRFFRSANTNLGVTALCLSGGASFGYYHFGVVKAFLDAGLLPRVITGTSAGGLIAAFVCTRTDAELKKLFVPELANRITACEDPFTVWFKRFWKTGARFDSLSWARKCTFFTRGSLTFREAYLRSGRILNISVIPADRHSPTKLLNYVTAPDTIIWTALLASAAVPGILNPVVLMQKLEDGRVVPWNWGSKFKDGSLRVDIPVQALNLYFNVTHPVVSQVNPHVHLFFFAPRGSAGKPVAHSKGKGWRGNFLLSAAEQWLKLELTKNFKVIRDLELLPQLLGQDWSSVFLQRFDGAVTIWPRTRFMDWIRILSDPDPPELDRMMKVGQIVTWPKLHMIQNRFRIEKQIFLGRQAVRQALLSKARPTASHSKDILNGDNIPEPITGSRLPQLFLTPTSTGEQPSILDTDLEAALVGGTYKPGGRPFNTHSGSSTPYDSHQVRDTPLRSATARRRRTSTLLSQEKPPEQEPTCPASLDPPLATSNAPTGRISLPPSPNFFAKLRAPSFPAMSSPFSTLHKLANEGSREASEQGWSSDSSSDEDLPLDDKKYDLASSLVDFPLGTDREDPLDLMMEEAD